MAEPETVAELVKHMQPAVDIPVTVKHRIGIDDFDSYEFMIDFVEKVAAAGCTRFIVHARTAWLQGLSPKQNREIPPLRYDDVYRLKQDFPYTRYRNQWWYRDNRRHQNTFAAYRWRDDWQSLLS